MLFFIILFVEDLWSSIQIWLQRIIVAIVVLGLMHHREIQELIQQQQSTTTTTKSKSLSNRLGRIVEQQSIDNNNTETIINEEVVEEIYDDQQRNDDNGNVDDKDLYDYGLEEAENEDDDDDINLDLGLEEEDDDDDKIDNDEQDHNDENIQPIDEVVSLSSSKKQIVEEEEEEATLLQQQRQKQFIKEMADITSQSSSSQKDSKIVHADGLHAASEVISSSAVISNTIVTDVDNNNDISLSKERTNKTINKLKQKQLEIKLKKKKQEEELEQKEMNAAKLFTATTTTTNDEHPGLDQFHHWYDTETSLFREYTLYTKNNNNAISYPGIRSKHNNKMVHKDDINSQIELRIGNTLSYSVAVYWIDHSGKIHYKGIIESYHTWVHITYLYHPFIICRIDNLECINDIDQQTMILQYIPYNIIPNVLPEAPTLNANNNIYIHQFVLLPPPSYTNNGINYNDYYCWIHDPILPYSSKETFITPRDAIGFTLLHSYRMKYIHWITIMKYITNIVMNPNRNIIYRIIKISNPIFIKCIWNYTCIRGIFYAAGFIENNNGYLQIGNSSTSGLSRERIQDLSQLLLAFELWQKRQQQE